MELPGTGGTIASDTEQTKAQPTDQTNEPTPQTGALNPEGTQAEEVAQAEKGPGVAHDKAVGVGEESQEGILVGAKRTQPIPQGERGTLAAEDLPGGVGQQRQEEEKVNQYRYSGLSYQKKEAVAPCRMVMYQPVAEDEAHGFGLDAPCVAVIVKVNTDESVNLHLLSPNSAAVAFVANVVQGDAAGQFSFPKRN